MKKFKRIVSLGLLGLSLGKGIPLSAQDYIEPVQAYHLYDDLFTYSLSDIDNLMGGPWSQDQILNEADWQELDEINGEVLDQSDVYWRSYRFPPLSSFDPLPIEHPVIVLELNDSRVRMFYGGREVPISYSESTRSIQYRSVALDDFEPGSTVFFRVKSNPFGGDEIYLTDRTIAETRPWLLSFYHIYSKLPLLVFGLIVILIGLTLTTYALIRRERSEYYMLWFGGFSLTFGMFSVLETQIPNLLYNVPPTTTFYVSQVSLDLVPVFLLLFYIAFMGDNWRRIFIGVIAGQLVVLGVHLGIVAANLFSEWADFMAFISPLITFLAIASHLLIRNRRHRYAIYFYLAFLSLALTYGLQIVNEITDALGALPFTLRPYGVLCHPGHPSDRVLCRQGDADSRTKCGIQPIRTQ
jgi:hypothetical protein